MLEEKLLHKENVIKAFQSSHPLVEIPMDETVESNEIFRLSQENEKLKSIIKQMREEMENIAFNNLLQQPSNNNNNNNYISNSSKIETPEPEYTISEKKYFISGKKEFEDDLKKQVLDLKQKNRELQSQIDEYLVKNKFPEKMTDNTVINSHIKSQNETISKIQN
jgi:hypothetical protein